MLVSLGRLAAPHADAFRPLVEDFIARQLGQSVEIRRVEASWPRLSPQISIQGLRIGAGGGRTLNVDRASLEFKLYNLVRPRHNAFELIVLGLDMSLVQDAEGRWRWRLDRGATLPERWERALSAGDLLVRDSSIEIVPRDLAAFEWQVPEARLTRLAQRVGIRLRAEASGGPESIVEARFELTLAESTLSGVRGHARTLVPTRIPATDPDRPGLILSAGAEAWLEWSRVDGGRLHARLSPESTAAPPGVEIDARWADGGGVRAEIDAATPTGGIVGLGVGIDGRRLAIAAERLDLDLLHALASPWADALGWWPRELSGTVSGLELGAVRGGGLYRAVGRFEGLHLESERPAFGLSGLAAQVSLDGDALVVAPSGAAELRLDELYSPPFALRQVGGRARLRPGIVDFDGLRLEHDEVSARIDGSLHWLESPVFVDLVVDTPRLSSQSPRRWLPQRGLPPKTRNWLDDALLSVASASAVTTLHGRPQRWPAHVPDGAVNSEVEFDGLALAYARGWPAAEQIAGWIEFSGERIRGRADAGVVAGVALRAPAFRIAEARNAEIELSVESADGVNAEDLSRLAIALPLNAADPVLSSMVWNGPAAARARIWLPVRRRDQWRLLGSVDFDGSDVAWPEIGYRLDAVRGALPFSRSRMGPSSLEAEAAGERVRLALDSRLQPEFSLSLTGRFPVRELLPEGWRATLPWLADRLAGSAGIELRFDRAAERDDGFLMSVRSDLVGVSSALPAPLAKSADSPLSLGLEMPLGEGAMSPLRFSVGGIANGEWLRTGDYWQLGLGLGPDNPRAALPTAENFRIEGGLPTLDFAGWAGLLGGQFPSSTDDRAGAGASGWLDVAVADLALESGSLGAVRVVVNREGEYWRLQALGERVDGTLRVPATGAPERALVADFERLHFPRSERETETAPAPPSTADPTDLPALDLAIDDLRLGDLALGEFRLTSHRSPDGLEIEQLSAQGGGFELLGAGAWTRPDGSPETRMRVRLSAADLGRALTEAGFDLALQQGLAVITLDGAWPGNPLDLVLERFDGLIELVVSDGVIPEASPGAGRLLGLVSLNSIPRRLRLDFSDVFGEGLAFDRVAGTFSLADGVATTDDLRIDAPAAEILMRGRTNLVDRSYDQTLIVRPGVGSALPVIGALAGGPVGAAAGAALQQIFSRPLQGISEIRYSVTGSWSEPQIRPIDVRAARDGEQG